MLCALSGAQSSPAQINDLHQQAAAEVLLRQFESLDISYILLDESGRVLAQRWENADRPIPIGSLIKPFLAVAYSASHQSFPAFTCRGKKTCWLPQGHGTLALREAIAFSCNSYFHQLNESTEPQLVAQTLTDYGLAAQTDGHSGSASPIALARAYLQLANHRDQPELAPIFAGMEMSARTGTAKAAGEALPPYIRMLAKTGTAPCSHGRKFLNDGFTVLLFPADHPRMLLLVRDHGHPGATTAGLAGKMVAAMEAPGRGDEGKPQ